MKTRRRTLWVGFAAALLAGVNAANANVVNGSFESWNLVGWTFSADTGTRAVEPLTRTAGQAKTVTSWGTLLGVTPMQPVEGYRFLMMNTRANANFVGDESYSFSVSQTLTLNLGDMLTGWAYFHNGDTSGLDSAWVQILDNEDELIGLPWAAGGSNDNSATAEIAPYGWFQWQWTAPSAGAYTVQLGMSTSGANNEASFALFDGVKVQTVPVPEPTAMVLAMVGGLALVALRNRKR